MPTPFAAQPVANTSRPGSTHLTAACLLAACAGEARAQWVTAPVSTPRVEYRTFQSAAAGAIVSYHVYTPPLYDADPARRFPVLYWLHGSDSVLTGIAPLASWFDTAIAQGFVPPMLVVFPNGWPYGMWCDSLDGARPIETMLVADLVPLVDATFRTIAAREGRLIEGFSMGGYGAGRIAFEHHQLFAAASLFGAGPLQLDFMSGPACASVPDAVRAMIYQDVWGSDPAYYLASSPWVLAEQNAASIMAGGLHVRIAVGQSDCMLGGNDALVAHLTQLGIPHDYATPPNVRHDTLALFNALGASNWAFYREVFGAAPTGTAFCLGDGSGASCPCGNSGVSGQGCANSIGVGARLEGSGSASITNDSFTLSVEPVPNTSVLFFQGTERLSAGQGAPFGDGLRCAGGVVVRLKTRTAAANQAQYPLMGEPVVSTQGSVPAPGAERHYQVWYRNSAAFCTPSNFNLSNGWTTTWTP